MEAPLKAQFLKNLYRCPLRLLWPTAVKWILSLSLSNQRKTKLSCPKNILITGAGNYHNYKLRWVVENFPSIGPCLLHHNSNASEQNHPYSSMHSQHCIALRFCDKWWSFRASTETSFNRHWDTSIHHHSSIDGKPMSDYTQPQERIVWILWLRFRVRLM